MALNRQNQQNIQDTATYVEDTLRSVAANIGEALKSAVDNAFTSADASILTLASKDFVRNMNAAARDSEHLVKNAVGLAQGLTTSANLAKQMQDIDLKRLALTRQFEYLKSLATDQDEQQLALMKMHHDAALDALDVQKASIAADEILAKDIEKRIGLTGKLAGAVAKIPGLGKFVDAKNIEQELRKAGFEGKNTFQIMGKAAGMVGKQLLSGLLDPLAFITFIWNGFMKVDKAATDFTRITGQNTSAISSMNSSLASTVDILEVASNLSKELGISGSNFISPEQLAAVAETKNLLGLSAEQATRLAIQTKMSGQNVATFKSNVMAGVKQSNLQNKSGVEYGVIIKDILNTSEDVTMSLGNNPKKLAAAATAARAFGLSLQQVDAIANTLMNFEESIGNELEAQLLTGKNINLSKARELALNNDLEGVANELAKNGASAAEFGKMNRIQQEGLAKALGMSREQLAKSVLAQEASKNLTSKQRADIMGMNELDYERVEVQERIQKSLDKIAQAFAPLLEKFIIPAVELLTDIMNLPLAPYFLLAAVAAKGLGFSISGIGKGFGSMYNMGKKALLGIAEFAKAPLQGLKAIGTRLAGGFRQGATGTGASSPWSPQQQQPATPTQGGGGMSNVTNSIQKINPAKLLAGAAALVIAAGAMFILGKAMQQFQGIGMETYLGAGAALLGLSLALAGLSMLSGPVLLGAAALLVGAAAVFVLGKALQEVGKALPIMAEGLGMIFPMLLGLTQALGPMLLLGPALFGIAAGLGAVSLAGLMALPAIGGLLALSAVAPALVSLGIGGGEKSVGESKSKSDEGTLAAVEAKLTELIAVVKTGGNVYLDSNKVGRAQLMAASSNA